MLLSYDEVNEAIEKLNNNKSVGLDVLPGEFFKNAGQDFIKEFTSNTVQAGLNDKSGHIQL